MEELEVKKRTLEQWLSDAGLEPGHKSKLTFDDDYNYPVVKARFWTKDYVVSIHAPLGRDYLGGYSKLRRYEAGEDWHRGNDMPDGNFHKSTFDAILRDAFVRHCVEDLPEPAEPAVDEVGEVPVVAE